MAGKKTPLSNRKSQGGLYNVEDLRMTTGTRWWVHSGTGSDTANSGEGPDDALATIDAAINKCVASVGDIVFVMPGHAETIAAAGIVADVIGLSIIGLGIENNRPTITFSATGSDVDIDATDVCISGLRFVSSVNNLAWFIDVNEERFTMEDCEFVTSSANEAYNFINIATTKDFFTFRRCVFRQPTDPDGSNHGDNTGCFYFEDSENITIDQCTFLGEFESSIFHNKTTAATNLWITDCYGEQALAGADVATIVLATTGGMVRCSWNVPDAADNTTIGSFITMVLDTFFGYHDVTFMNDNNAGEWAASPVNAAMA
jgi:hypothetical protein